MSVTQDNWLMKRRGPFVENGLVPSTVTLHKEQLGYDPEAVRTRHLFSVTGTTGGTVVLAVEGPDGTWLDHTTGLVEDDVVEVTKPYSGFRFTFTATGGAGQIDLKGYAQGWA